MQELNGWPRRRRPSWLQPPMISHYWKNVNILIMTQNGWVKPDFGTAATGSFCPVRKVQNDDSAQHDCNRKKRPQESTKNMKNICTPTSSSELVVQKKKIADVKCWLEQAFSTNNHQAQFLLLTGPPGCGKYQTLSTICKELHIDILTWEEPIRHYNATEWDIDSPAHRTESNQTDSNFYNHLEEFLERTSRFCTLKMKDRELSLHPKPSLRKILLVQDYPPMIFQNLERWHNILLKFGSRGKIPAVFILTNNKAFSSMQLKLFPHDLQERLNISTINFSGLANTFVLKALQKIAVNSQKATPIEVIQAIAGSCNGDLRSALNTMNWMNMRSNNNEKQYVYPKKRKLSSKHERNALETAYVRDGSMDFMHAIGKILHSKRLNEAQCNSPGLPPHLLDEFRMPLKENVNELTRNIGDTSHKVLLYLHHNYPVYFNKIEDVSKAIGYLSSIDSLSNQITYKEIYEEYSLLTAIRGLMFSNTSVNGSTWRPLRKPDHFAITLKQQDLRSQMQEINGKQCGPSFFSETWPFMRLIRDRLKTTSALNQVLELDYGYKLEDPKLRTIQTTTHAPKLMELEAQKFPVTENATDNSEIDTDILIEEYED
ncbi:cell cycle checkpoint protein RAD17-like isoform X2 [Daphnia carinata]|uniref:cell cycle checkpoint protein RAD17-like isoform X2 n=1 Tax=Daphnia carinata TaxID=120202 RepID=UPI00257ECF47|nr:cell cycle checkpoint protein RAD17-like isoform X2 [Daphnia carinata]